MELGLGGKVAVVTGASKGIGLAVAASSRTKGALVVAGARSIDALAGIEGVSAVCRRPRRSRTARAARRPRDRAARAGRRARQQRGRRPAAPRRVPEASATLTSRRRCSSTSSPRCGRLAPRSPHARARRGAIVNVASVNAFFQPDGRYRLRRGEGGAAQRLEGAVAGARPTGHPHQLRLARPGRDRPLARRRRRRGDGRPRDRRRPRRGARRRPRPGIPTGRFSTPEEVATLVVLLASPRTANVTGADYVIDGGLIKTT